MPRIPLLGASYEAQSVIADAQRCINLYPEANPKDSPVPLTHYPTPGLILIGVPGPLPATGVTTWNPLDKDTTVVLSMGNLEACVVAPPVAQFIVTTISNDAVAAYSGDGITWANSTTPAGGWRRVATSSSLAVAVDNGSTNVITSPDGITWTQRSTISVASFAWQDIAWNGTVYCAIGQASGPAASTVAATSPDGITWTQRTMPSGLWSGLTWNGTIFCAVSGNPSGSTIAATSPDGITWTSRTLPVNAAWVDVAWNGTVFCTVSSSPTPTQPTAATSSDGITWIHRTLPAGLSGLLVSAIAWNGTVFCLVTQDGSEAATSPDGITWTLQNGLPLGIYNDITVNNSGLFCTVSGNFSGSPTGFGFAVTSPDGVTWTQRSIPNANVIYFGIAYGLIP